MALSITKLTRKEQELNWNDNFKASFQELKWRLTLAPISIVADPEKKFKEYCDTLRQGLGCLLMQEQKICCICFKETTTS